MYDHRTRINAVIDAGVDAGVQDAINLPGSNAGAVAELGLIGCVSVVIEVCKE